MKNTHSVDLPLLFFFLLFVIVALGLFSKLAFQKQSYTPKKQIEKKTPISLDYNKPIFCDYHTKTASISAAMNNSSVGVAIQDEKTTQHYIVEGDCLYSWIYTEQRGRKKCGVGSYIPLVKQLLGSGLGSVDSLIAMIPKTEKTTHFDLKAVFETCKNVREVKKEMFEVPKGMKFDE